MTLGGLKNAAGEVSTGPRPMRTLRVNNARVACSFDLRGKRVLDVGCAEGIHALYMAHGAEEVIGIDHRASVIAIAEANRDFLGVENVSFHSADARDRGFFDKFGKFDLIVAWGLLHRITDVFSFLYTIAPLAETLSLEWRTPVFPFMTRLSIGYHSPAGTVLDPLNLGAPTPDAIESTYAQEAGDEGKVEGDTGFWDPTPGAVSTIGGRLGFGSSRVLGYGHNLAASARPWRRNGYRILRHLTGQRPVHQFPVTRVHMVLERAPGAVPLANPMRMDLRFPDWDVGLQAALS